MVKSPSPVVPASKVIPASTAIPTSRGAASRAPPPAPDDASMGELIPPEPDAFEPPRPMDPPEPLTLSAPAPPPADPPLPPPPPAGAPFPFRAADDPQPNKRARDR